MYGRPTHREMIREAVGDLDGRATYAEIRDWICGRYGSVNRSAITANIIMCTVNHPSRIHYPQSSKPRVANGRYDFLYRVGRGRVALYDPKSHGAWEVRRGPKGEAVVAEVGGQEHRTRGGGQRAVPMDSRILAPRIPTEEAFLAGIREYDRREQREAVYRTAALVVSRFWGEHAVVADAVAALLVSWNRAFYRFGMFEIAKLQRCIADNAEAIERFRRRDISSLAYEDEASIGRMFGEFIEASRIGSGSSRGRQSAVSAAKALHLLAPRFFPIWDRKIARIYGCHYGRDPIKAYWEFCHVTRDIAEATRQYSVQSDKTLVKLIDEYNYSKFAKGWI